jgi:hypothetical protein
MERLSEKAEALFNALQNKIKPKKPKSFSTGEPTPDFSFPRPEPLRPFILAMHNVLAWTNQMVGGAVSDPPPANFERRADEQRRQDDLRNLFFTPRRNDLRAAVARLGYDDNGPFWPCDRPHDDDVKNLIQAMQAYQGDLAAYYRYALMYESKLETEKNLKMILAFGRACDGFGRAIFLRRQVEVNRLREKPGMGV